MQPKIKNGKLKEKSFLEEIIKLKKKELSRKSQKIQETGFLENQSFRNSGNGRFYKLFNKRDKRTRLIAELKFASPTIPDLGSPDELVAKAKQYELSGADAISVVTEKHFFKGELSFISKVKKAVPLPVLQKDFIIDQSQIYEAKKAGADALLLIARLVSIPELKKFVSFCLSLEIEPVVEINNEEDLEKAVVSNANIIAVNARDLETFKIDVKKACSLVKRIPEGFIKLCFSGVHSQREVIQYQKAGAKGILVGTSLMKSKDIKSFIKSLQL